ncbi:MarR family transcriptional regulator [Massilia sp. CCM 9210]|nr:MarR family transcriptional regulator [Massilia sp. CCM 9210]MDQ1817435.1 MarR family transcriptional regulator [Massilia sp. CCM 9210]
MIGILLSDASEPVRSGSEVPTVWFASMASLAAVLSDDNRALLRLIHERQPKSLTELAAWAGRKVPNLSRTLRTMAGHGLVELKKNARDVQPIALAIKFLVVVD